MPNPNETPIKTEWEIVCGDLSQIFTDPVQLAISATKVDRRKGVQIFVRETYRREITHPEEPQP